MFDNHERLAGMRLAWEGRVRAWRTCTLGQEFGDNPLIGRELLQGLSQRSDTDQIAF